MAVSQDIQDFITSMTGVVSGLEAQVASAAADKQAGIDAVTQQLTQDHNDEVAALKAALAAAQGNPTS